MIATRKYLILLITILTTVLIAAHSIDKLNDPFSDTKRSTTTREAKNMHVIKINNIKASEVVEFITPYFPDILFKYSATKNLLIFHSAKTDFSSIRHLIRMVDTLEKQVLIEVKVLEIAQNSLSELGTIFSLSSSGFMLNSSGKSNIEGTLKLLIGKGKARILAAPRVTTIVNKEAVIKIGDKLPYSIPIESSKSVLWSVKYIDAGIHLKIKPLKVIGNLIELEILPEVSSIKQWKITQSGEYPVISTRRADTILRVKSKESFVLGGLLNKEERNSLIKTPLLSDIPIIGSLFSKSTTETIDTDIVFFVTATIM